MSRLPIPSLLAALLCLAAACDDKKAAGTAATPPSAEPKPVAEPTGSAEPAATPVTAAAEPAAKPAEPAATPAAKPAEPAPASPAGQADPGAAPAEGAPVDPASLAGQYGFGWSGGKTMKCKKVDEKMIKTLSGKGASCRQRDPGAAFAEGAGAWSACEVGKAEWVIFATKAICQEQLETMEANAP